jgi:predicted nucleotidyltransferase
LEERGITKYAVQRNPSSIVVTLPNESESNMQRHVEALSRLLGEAAELSADAARDVIFRDPRDDRAIVIEVRGPASAGDGKDAVVRKLKAEENELRRRGVASLLLFGSASTSKPYPNDVDLLARFRSDVRLSAFDLAGIRLYLEDRLGRRVDLSSEKSFPAEWKQRVEQTGIRIFDS